MKLLAAFLLALAFPLWCPPALAQGPRLTTAGSNESFPLTSVRVTVRLLADVAETELEIAFTNPEQREREAEFILPLPPGAVVNGYALDNINPLPHPAAGRPLAGGLPPALKQ